MARAGVRVAAVTLAVLALAGGLAPGAQAGWGRPMRLSGPQPLDVTPAQIAFSPLGDAAITFGVLDPESPWNARAFTVSRTRAGALTGPRRVPGALAVLAVAFDGPSLNLLTGASPPGRACCATARVTPSRGRATVLVRGLTGITDGELVPLGANGSMLAAVATERGVWVSQSTAGRFPVAHRLSFAGSPGMLTATALPSGAGVAAWTLGVGSYGALATQILVATGSPTHAPSKAAIAVTVPAGHSIDELALATGRRAPTLAWVESWYDARGAFHSAVEVRDLSRGARTQTVSPSFELASDVALSSDPRGDQVVAFDGCSDRGACVARAAVRRAGGPLGRARWLGPVDPSQPVAAAISARGEALVSWISHGHVIAAAHSLRAAHFGRPRVVSSTDYAADLALAFGPGRDALAVWTDGTDMPVVRGSVFAGR